MKPVVKKSDSTQKALNLWAVILIVWSFYRVRFRFPDYIDEFVFKPLVFILPVYYYIVRQEKQRFFQGLNWRLKVTRGDLAYGFGMGAMFFLMAAVVILLKNGSLAFSGKQFSAASVMMVAGMSLATAVSEEVLSRGFILKRLYADSGKVLTSSLFASFLFFFLHIPMLFSSTTITGNVLFFVMASDIILSMINSLLFIGRKSLNVPILVHMFYSLTVFFLF